jgi:hypothetical protein
MQEKESKSSTHYRLSLIKSAFRFGACFGLLINPNGIQVFAVLMVLAEILGIAEEVF